LASSIWQIKTKFKQMRRRDFIRNSVGLGIAGGVAPFFG